MTIHYGVVGCGGHAVQSHIKHGEAAGFSLVGVYDPDSTAVMAAVRTGNNAAAIACDSYEELLRIDGLQAVVITSPDQLHPEQLAAAVEAGLHVLVDKPLAVSTGGMHRVRNALEAVGPRQVITSCHPRRFDPPYLWVKQNLPGLTLTYGPLVRVELDFSYHAPMADWKHSRSLLMDHFPHEIDFLNWLLGLESFEAWRLSDGPQEYTVAGRRRDGISFLCSGTRHLEKSIYPETIYVRFARGECWVNTKTGEVRAADHDRQVQEIWHIEPTDYDRRFEDLMVNFAQAIRDPASNYLTAEDLIINTASAIELADSGTFAFHRS